MTKRLNISLRPNPNGDRPHVDSTAHIDPTAQVIGNVHIEPRAYIGPNAVIRADEADDKGDVKPIEIGAECNVQDGVIIHALGGTQVTIGQRTSLAHGCIIHGPCTLGRECFVGFRAVIYDARLADGVFVGTGAVVQGVSLAANTFVPPAVAVLSGEDVARWVSTTKPTDCEFMKKVVIANLALTKEHVCLDEQKLE